jgi:hypothetical protein
MSKQLKFFGVKTFVFTFFLARIYAQAPDMEWNKGYGTNQGEHIHEIMQTSDGGYIGIGQMSEGGNKGMDILVIKIDSTGEFLWQQIIGTKGNPDIGICVEETEDGYVIGGGLFEGNQQRYLAKLDFDGKFIWQKTYPGKRNGMIRGIDVLSNGELITTGYKNCRLSGFVFIADNSDGFIMKVDSDGKVVWEKPISAAQGAKVRLELGGKGFVLCTTQWMNHPEKSEDFCLIKTDLEGNEYWSQTYGGQDNDEHCYDFDLSSDGGYILGGHTRSPSYGVINWDFLLMKIGKEGNEEWHRTFGQPRGYDPRFIHDEAYGVRQTFDGGYVIVGGTGDEHEYSESGSPYGDSDIWKVYLVKVNANGELLWHTVYGSNTENNAGEYLGLTRDGGFIIGSDSDSAGKDNFKPNNFGFMKIAPDQ